MVVGDLGLVEMADPHARMQKKLRASDNDIHVCTPHYRPPDVALGNQHFQEDLDMWSFGCVAAELYSHRPLMDPAPAKKDPGSKDFVDAIVAIVGPPGLGADDGWRAWAASWLEDLPFFQK